MNRKQLFQLFREQGITKDETPSGAEQAVVDFLVRYFGGEGYEAWATRPKNLGEGIKEYETQEEMARAIVREAIKDLKARR